MGKKNMTPAGARREVLAEALRARGQSPFSIWLARPPFDSEDITLNSDLAYDLFHFLEGEPEFVGIDYSPLREPDALRMPSIEGRIFAWVTDRKNERFSIRYSPLAEDPVSQPPTPGQRVITLAMIDPAVQRIENWRRVLPAIRRVRVHPTATIENAILLATRDCSRTIREVLAMRAEDHPALVFGAIGILLRRRRLASDLDRMPWSLHTQLSGAAP